MKKQVRVYTWRDPFAGDESGYGTSIVDAIALAYAGIPEGERPRYVVYRGERIDVPGGLARPS